MTPDELPAYWARLIQRLGDEGPRAAANAMGAAYQTEVTDVELVRSSHSPGSRTPARPGDPPAAVSGTLRRSVRLFHAVSTGAWKAQSKVVPLVVYARIQELGGVVTAKHTYTDKRGVSHPGYLRWGASGDLHFARSVRIPERPYMRPAHRRMVTDGRLRKAAADAVRRLVL